MDFQTGLEEPDQPAQKPLTSTQLGTFGDGPSTDCEPGFLIYHPEPDLMNAPQESPPGSDGELAEGKKRREEAVRAAVKGSKFGHKN